MDTPDRPLKLRGTVNNIGGGSPSPSGLRVVAVDNAAGKADLLLVATTVDGEFEFEFSEADAALLFRGSVANLWTDTVTLVISVYNGELLLTTVTVTLALGTIVRGALPQPISVNLDGTAANNFSVSGRVVTPSGAGYGTAQVAVLHMVPGAPAQIAVANGDAEGNFVVEYPGIDSSTPEQPGLDLQLVVIDTGDGNEVGRSPILFAPSPHHRVDIVVGQQYTGRSEFERIEAGVARVAPGVTVTQLHQQELELIAKRADVYPAYLAVFIQAARLADGRNVSPSDFYALLRANLGPDLASILSRSLSELRRALVVAYERRLITAPAAGTVDSAVAASMVALEDLVVDATMAAAVGGGQGTREVLDTSGLAESSLRTWMRIWLQHEGTRAEFWEAVEADGSLTAPTVATLRFTTEAAALTRRFLPTMTALHTSRSAGTISTVADLAQWDVPEWIALLGPGGAPAGTPGADATEQVANYAAQLNRTVGEQHPTRRLAHRLARDTPPQSAGVAEFLDANPTFDINTTIASIFIAENPGTMPAGHDPAVVESNLKAIQRLHQITPKFERYEVTQALLNAGFRSAGDIVHLGKTGFVAAVGSTFDGLHLDQDDSALATSVYGAAMHKHGMSMALVAQYGAPFNDTPLVAMPLPGFSSSTQPGGASLDELFGALDYCSCEHCRSVLSPAAYLVDLLALLEGMPATGQPNVLEVLRQRRGDIVGLELSCTNTNTTLPHIDLVNELLERRVVSTAGPFVARQTTRTAAELRLAPEHRDDAAYDAPATAVFPWSLPVAIPTEELRAYGHQLGASRVEVMRALAEGATGPTLASIVAESLGLSHQAAHLLSADTLFSAGVTPTAIDAAWGMAGVPDFHLVLAGDLAQLLDRAELTFDELVALLDNHFVNPSGAVSIEYAGGEPTCDLDDISLTGVTPGMLDRLHRFVRLGRITGRSVEERTLTIDEVGENDLHDEYLYGLMRLTQVEQRLRLSAWQVSSLWNRISLVSYGGKPSAFEALFQDPLLSREPDPAFNVAGNELAAVVALAPAHYPTIRAALRLSDSDLRRLIDDVVPVSGAFAPPAPALNVANLSILHRHACLARALGLTIDQLLTLRSLIATNPFVDAVSTLEFADVVAEISAAQITIEQLDYLCRYRFSPDGGQRISDREIAAIVTEIAVAVDELDELLNVAGDRVAVARAHLEAVFDDATVVEDWIRILALPALSVADRDHLIATLVEAGLDSGFVTTTLEPNFGNRHGVTSDFFSEHRRVVGRRLIVANALSAGLNVSVGTAEQFAFDQLDVGDVLVDASLLNGDGSPGDTQVEAVVRLHQGSIIVKTAGLQDEDLDWYFGNTASTHGLDLSTLPATPTPDGTSVFEGWLRIHRAQSLRSEFSSAQNIFALIVEQPNIDAVATLIAERSSWSLADIQWALGPAFLNETLPANLGTAEPLSRVRKIMALVQRTGMEAQQLAQWALPPTAAAATQARRALRARYSDTQWPDVIRPIADQLREARRDALMATLLGRGTFNDEAEIYEELLIDPEMSACMLTSRVKQAISSVQLLVQRGLMHMESTDFTVDPELSSRWEWTKNYRVWEANRKVFFYPQNWVEPELRDDKSPFFREFEQQLDQGELSDANVEQALKDYLYKLHEVSHLDVVALYEEEPAEGGQVVHVIGRTRAAPRKHFYRRRHDDQYWTAWEEVPLDIPSAHVLAVSYNRRLFLFWAEFVRHSPKQDDGSAGDPEDQIAVAWSEYRDGQWSPKRISELARVPYPATADKQLLMLMGHRYTGGLVIDIVHDHPDDTQLAHSRHSFLYDDCRDELVEWSATVGHEHREAELGLTVSRRSYAQQQNQRVVGDFERVWRSDEIGGYSNSVLIRETRGHRVTLTRQDIYHSGARPAVFDSSARSLYVTPLRVSAPPPGGPMLPVPLVVDPFEGPGSVTMADDASQDDVQTLEPWGGLVPGIGMTLTGQSAESEAAGVLTSAVETITAETAEWVPGGAPAEPMGSQWLAGYRLAPFSHPYTCSLRTDLNHHGIEGVLGAKSSHRRQLTSTVPFSPPGLAGGVNELTSEVALPYPLEDFDFTFGGAYSLYNWELFFHIPMYIAERLRTEQRFEQAQRWHHYIFNPLAGVEPGVTGPERFWNVKPLFQETVEDAPDIIESIFSDDGLAANPSLTLQFLASVFQWLKHPFSPHAIARIRPGTYRWVAVRKYLDNLLDWADSLFRRDTIESINEATQLYVLAASILGPRPKRLPEIDTPARTYNDLAITGLFGGLAELEGFLPPPPADLAWEVAAPPEPLPAPVWWYFCVPPNEQLLSYWDTVADRLFKVRHCQNIDGVVRQLPLFEPPIDPALLVRAKAAGLDLSSVLDGLNAPMPTHRYRVLAARALELCGDVRALGAALIGALEKKDTERLSQLRAKHESSLLQAVRDTRVEQIHEAEQALSTIDNQILAASERHLYYAGRKRHSSAEKTHLKKLKLSSGLMIAGQSLQLVASVVRQLPSFIAGPVYLEEEGGRTWASIPALVGDALSMGSAIVRNQAERQQINAGYDRRYDDWQFQARQAQLDISGLKKQRVAAEIRLDIARKELDSHDRQAAQATTFELAIRDKYTNDELYSWMVSQVSSVYFQTYKLAHEMARKAERAMQWELASSDTFIEYGHWDSLRKGLMAGERLQLDLRRMEVAYLDRRVREYEITKRISLRQLNPAALLDLRDGASCEFALPEALFDLDHPGHYMRRIKAVSVSVPAVVGPHTSLGATLTMLQDQVRVSSDLPGGNYMPVEPATVHDDDRFRIGYGGTSSIATSRGREDTGLFVLDFRDERLLPFEGAGAVSQWRLELPDSVRQFDYDSISDVEIQIQYTARSGGASLRSAVETHLSTQFDEELAAANDDGLALLLSAKEAFGPAWRRFIDPAQGQAGDPIEIPIQLGRFGYPIRSRGPAVTSVQIEFVARDNAAGVFTIGAGGSATLTPPSPGVVIASDLVANGANVSATLVDSGDPPASIAVTDEPWMLSLTNLTIERPEDVRDLLILVNFQLGA